MPVTVVGELTVDQSSIILLATGADHEVADAARQLQTLTPLIKPTNPPGAVQLPATWPAVVQLSATFAPHWRPGPALAAWIAEQIRRRTPPAEPTLLVAPPAGLAPRSYQIEAACLIREVGSVLIFDEPGTGKTAETVLGLVDRAAAGHTVLPVVVVAPNSVVDPWVTEFSTWAPQWRALAWRGTPQQRRALAGTADVYVTSYGTARMDAAATNERHAPLIALRPTTVVADECLPAGTPVDTANGPRPIESLRVGDLVMGVDHATGTPVATPILRTFANRTTSPLTSVNGVEMTPDHPVWTGRGYVPAGAVRPDDCVCEVFPDGDGTRDVRVVRQDRRGNDVSESTPPPVLRTRLRGEGANSAASEPAPHAPARRDVRLVRSYQAPAGTPEQATPAVLQSQLLDAMADVTPGVHGHTRHGATPRSGPHKSGCSPAATRGSGENHRPSVRANQPVPGSSGSPEGPRGRTCPRLPGVDGRQRPGPDQTANAASRRVGLADGSGNPDSAWRAVPLVIQGRHRVPAAADRDRGGRQQPQRSEGSRTGYAQAGTAHRAWLDSAAVHQPSGTAKHRSGAGRDPGLRVFNIETGTGNYIADGLLVHNCHQIRHQATEQSRAVRRLAAKATTFVGLSGTPITHTPADLWPALTALEPGAWPSRERWVERYCLSIPGDYTATVLSLDPSAEGEFRTTLLGRHRRVAKADVLAELPPKVHTVRTVDLPAEYRKAYDGLEADMLAELPDGGELSVMSVLAQLTRLAQLASAAADVSTRTETVADPDTGLPIRRTHQTVTLKAPSWKVDALLDILDERPGEPVVAFAPSRQLISLAGNAAHKAGRRVGYIVGGQTPHERTGNVNAFQRGELDLICVTTGAGGVGLTLTAARTAVFLQRPWSLVEATQSEDRLHRLGAQRHDSIDIIDVIARNTIDTRVRAILRQRAGQLADLVQDRRVVTELLGGTDNRRAKKAAA